MSNDRLTKTANGREVSRPAFPAGGSILRWLFAAVMSAAAAQAAGAFCNGDCNGDGEAWAFADCAGGWQQKGEECQNC
jgi:hypothetical protein